MKSNEILKILDNLFNSFNELLSPQQLQDFNTIKDYLEFKSINYDNTKNYVLKVKDSVDLEILEKYGFEEFGGSHSNWHKSFKDCDLNISLYSDLRIINIGVGEIGSHLEELTDYNIDVTLFKMFEDGLLEFREED